MNDQGHGAHMIAAERLSERAPPSEQDLHRYLDGRLDAAESAKVAAYLASHPEQAATVAAYRAQIAGLHALYDATLSEPVPQSMLDLVQRQRSRSTRRIILFVLAALALSALSGMAGWWANDLMHAERAKS
jgi:anti-sigma factor RsiW